MTRNILAAAVLGLACGAAAFADDAAKPGDGKPGKFGGKGGFDKGKLFEKADANGDGKLTKDEYTAFTTAVADKVKDKTGKALPDGFSDKMFARLDANGDGVVTKDEYEKGGPLGGKRGPGGKNGGKGKGKPDGGKKPATPAAE